MFLGVNVDYIKIASEVLDIEAESILNSKEYLSDDFSKAIESILNTQGRVVITGMGKSGLIGRKISATLASTGTKSMFLHPAEAYHGDLGIIHPYDVVIAISNSGETDELIKLIPFLKDNSNTIIALTGKQNSTLAKNADFFINVGVEKEACPLELAPTSSTTVTLAIGDAISVSLMRARDFQPENFARFHPGGSLGRRLLTTVNSVMKSNNLPIISEATLFEEALGAITSGRLGIAIVCEDEKLRGVVSDGDLRRFLTEKGKDAIGAPVREFMTINPVIVRGDQKLVEVEELMSEKKITTVVVSSDSATIDGVLQIYDI